MATVGSNFKRIRNAKKITQEAIYERLGFKRPANVSLLEKRTNVPPPERIRQMADVLGCEPWELLMDVPFPHDEIRRLPTAEEQERLRVETLARKTEQAIRRQERAVPGRRKHKRLGKSFAKKR